jgi:hypothetical protein
MRYELPAYEWPPSRPVLPTKPRAAPGCSFRRAILRACLSAPVIAMFTKRLSTRMNGRGPPLLRTASPS